jgi:hypothetical protein
MPITLPQAPANGENIVSENLGGLLATQAAGVAAVLKSVRSEELSIAGPHQSYVVALQDIAEGRILSAARPIAWRYLIVQGNDAVAEVELNADEKVAKELDFLGLHESPFANATLEALRLAEELPQAKKQDYELRYLKIPAVYLAAIWLHNESDDILIPLFPTPKGLKAEQLYSENQLSKALQPAARLAKDFDDHFEENQGPAPER